MSIAFEVYERVYEILGYIKGPDYKVKNQGIRSLTLVEFSRTKTINLLNRENI